jgi:nicotinamide-nucleotide amidase
VFTADQLKAAEALLDSCRKAGLKLATAESCTGGLVAGLLTSIAGSSDVIERGFVVYSNKAKEELLDVPAAVIKAKGAVSEEAARALAEGALGRSDADLAVAITGVAGPGGGSREKPVGLVHIAAARKGRPTAHQRHLFKGDRAAVRSQSVDAALALISRQIGR